MPDPAIVEGVISACNGAQYRHDQGKIEPLKRAAKAVCTDLLNRRLRDRARILDVGGEEFYQRDLGRFDVVSHNLPDDMHDMPYVDAFDAAIAMHVLEHSPFPMLVLTLLRRALKPGGIAYIAVPHPSPRLCTGYGHWSVLPPDMWQVNIEGAGLTIESRASGKMGRRPDWVEERFVCRK